MTWHTNPAVIAFRNTARRLGLTGFLARLHDAKSYGHAFDVAIFSALRMGDEAWDVGANVGYCTKRFAETVGPDGHVVAFEPFPATAERRRALMQDTPNHGLQMLALGAKDSEVKMQAGWDDLGATDRIIPGAEHRVEIRIAAGDGVLGRNEVPVPTVLKIDNEGVELDVLQATAERLDSAGFTTRCVDSSHIAAERG